MELEEEGSLPFLDTRVTRLANCKLDITAREKGYARSRVVARDFRNKITPVFRAYPRVLAESALRFTMTNAWTRFALARYRGFGY